MTAVYCTCFGTPCKYCQQLAIELEDEADAAKAKLAWFEKREAMVRALVGAVEDIMLAELAEWRALVDWEMENRS